MRKQPSKLALVSHALPPAPSGQAVVLYRLFSGLDPNQYILLSARDPDREIVDGRNAHQVTRPLPARHIQLPAEGQIRLLHSAPIQWLRQCMGLFSSGIGRAGIGPEHTLASPLPSLAQNGDDTRAPSQMVASVKERFKSGLQWLEDRLNFNRRIRLRASRIHRAIIHHECSAVMACSGDLYDLPASFLAARRAKVSFYAYMFDDYATHWSSPFGLHYAQAVTGNMVRAATGVIVTNESLVSVYRARYGVEPVVIPNPVDIGGSICPPELAPPGQPIRIVYTGAVYDAHYDAFRSLLAAIRSLADLRVELHIYTPSDRQILAAQGIVEPALVHAPVSSVEAQRLQQSADIVFLPLAFQSPFPDLIHTSAPGKMGELLASGRPILVHAPPRSFVSTYARTHECAAVVDCQDLGVLRSTLGRLACDAAWRQALVARAWQQARQEFALPVVQARFRKLLEA